MQAVAARAGQALAPHEDGHSARLVHQLGRQGHGVGRAAKKRCPQALAFWRHMIGQDAHGAVLAQFAHHVAHASQRGRHGAQAGAVAHMLHHFDHPALVGRAVHHGQVAVLPVEALGHHLRGNFKAAQVRGQKDNAALLGVSLLDMLDALPECGHGLAQPQAG